VTHENEEIQSLYVYRRIAPPLYKIKRNEVSPDAFTIRPGMKGLSVFRADMASPRQVLEARLEEARNAAKSEEEAVRSRAVRFLANNPTVEALVRNSEYRLVKIRVADIEAMGFTLETPEENGHVNILGAPETFESHKLDIYRADQSRRCAHSLDRGVSRRGMIEREIRVGSVTTRLRFAQPFLSLSAVQDPIDEERASAMRSVILAALLICIAGGVAEAQEAAEKRQPMLQHEFITVNGIKLHYAAVGQGQVILFLHGFPEFWYAWNDLLPEFGKDYRAVAADMRGYNLSDKPARVEDYAVPLLVADVKGLLERLSPGKKAILVGHDWGGAVAYAFALTHPEMLEKLVIINAPHPAVFSRELRENSQQQQASAYMNLFRSPQAEAILSANNYAALAAGVFGGARPGAFPEEKRRRYLEAWAQPGALTGGLNYYRAARIGPPSPEPGASEPPEDLSRLFPSMEVRVPTLVIWGEKDAALLTGNLKGLEKYVPKLTVRRIPDAGHWVVHEEPGRVTQYIREFLGGR
jgi:pimeloyl-ACP methyl ester carboxylesterase